MSLENAQEIYPDNEQALAKIKDFVLNNISHTEKWIVDRIYSQDRALARIYAEKENRVILRDFIKEEKLKNK